MTLRSKDQGLDAAGIEAALPHRSSVRAKAAGAGKKAAPEPLSRRLDEVLRALPQDELASLAERVGIHLDDRKRIDPAQQVARALVRLPDVREPARLPPASAALLYRICAAGGGLTVPTLPPDLEALAYRGIVFARVVPAGVELVLPTALLVQVKPWEAEDPRSLRVLLAEAPFETASAIASHYLNRPCTPPVALWLETAWEVLSSAVRLKGEMEVLAHEERRLLDAIERLGGEVDSQELMDLERGPMRVRSTCGVASGRRGAAFALEKRGLLFPVHPNRYVVPIEVAAIIGAERRRERAERRERIRAELDGQDFLPRRARFFGAPAPLALAMAIAVREGPVEVRQGVGTPRSLLGRLSQRFGRDVETTALLAALSRAVGLWDDFSTAQATPPFSLRVAELSRLLFDTWRGAAVWDEARLEPETLRAAPEHRDTSPVRVVREMVLGALQQLGDARWIPCEALLNYLQDDARTAGLERLFARWAVRNSMPAPVLVEVARRIATCSLPALGAVDIGELDQEEPETEQGAIGLALRLTARGRSYLEDRPPESSVGELTANTFAEPQLLRVGDAASVGAVLELAALAELAAVEPHFDLRFVPAALARALAAGLEPQELRRRTDALAEPTPEVARLLDQATAVLGKGMLIAANGFLWVENDDVRELLRTRAPCADLFVDPSPPAGLLVAPGVDPERLIRRCRTLGVEIELQGGG